MTFRPYTVARWGLYGAAGAALMSVWLGRQAGASLDFLMLRAVFVFVIVSALAFAAEAILSSAFIPAAPGPQPKPKSTEPGPVATEVEDE
jgi:hypothetical protein